MPRDPGFFDVFERTLRGYVPDGVRAVIDLAHADTSVGRALMTGPRREAIVEICREAIVHVTGFEEADTVGISVRPEAESIVVLVQSDVVDPGPNGGGASRLRDVLFKHGAWLADEFHVLQMGTTVRLVLPARAGGYEPRARAS